MNLSALNYLSGVSKRGIISTGLNGFLLRILIFFSALALSSCERQDAADIFRQNSSAVVSIQIFSKDDELIGAGSGVVISESGKILTNYHVLEFGEKLEIITESKKKYLVTGVIAADKNVDYALLKIDSDETPKIKIGDSSISKIGERVFTISSPSSAVYQNTFASGEISGIRQRELLPTGQTVENVLGRQLLQISAPISTGSSGGALLNEKGELIGLLVAKSSEGENLNFAIPVNEVKNAFDSKSYLPLSTFKDLSAAQNPSEIRSDDRSTVDQNNLSLNPRYSFKDLLRLGNQSFEKESYNDAILAWLEALKEQPRNVVVLNKIAYALVRLKQSDRALEIYEEALKINPNHYLTIFNLGELSHQMYLAGCVKCKEEALGLYSRSLELNPPPHVERQAIERILSLKSE